MKKIYIVGTLVAGIVIGTILSQVYFLTNIKVTKEIKESHPPTTPISTKDEKSHSMDEAMTDMSSGLKGKTGDKLDRAFLREMIVHHQGAVDMAQIVLDNSKRLELRKFAENIILVQQSEIKMMMDWSDKWFPN